MKHINLVKSLFGEEIEYQNKSSEIEVCRNEHEIYNTPSGSYLVKKFTNPQYFEREKKGYEFFKKNNLVKIPELFYAKDSIIVIEYLKKSRNYDLEKTLEDWANVHSVTRKKDSDRLLSVVHGDLYGNNVVNTGEEQYYIDFENLSLGHPVKDLALILFNESRDRKDIIDFYRKLIDFDYEGIINDINFYYNKKLKAILHSLSKETKIPNDFRIHYMEKVKRELKKLDF